MDLLILIAIIAAISKAFGKNKQKGGKSEFQQEPAATPAMDHYYAKRFAGMKGSAAAQMTAKKPVVKPIMVAAPKATPAQPTVSTSVHTHTAPACDEHDQPGSLGVKSPEGVDACHEEMLPPASSHRPAIAPETEAQPGLTLDWSGENMVKAFIMQEVLTRPCDRRRRA